MTEIRIEVAGGNVPVYVAEPPRAEPAPVVVVIHDALGMTTDLRNKVS